VEERPPVSEVPVDIDMLSDRMRVLLVEDNIISQTVLKRQLVKAGLTCDGEYSTILIRPSYAQTELILSQWRTTARRR
jgi:CheY-like chemotaxis protein